jgi:mono/diheme cytochrome c family protein
MGGFELSGVQVQRLIGWLDTQPAPRRSVGLDLAASERGRELFESREVGCAECHSGALMTNNETVDVGTGEMLQVPSLSGVSLEGPYMHDGCAATLADRFGPCGGGDRHGKTSQLTDAERSDLVEYLRTL